MKNEIRTQDSPGGRNAKHHRISGQALRSDQKPYHTRTSGVCVEVLRVFDTKEAATAMEKNILRTRST